MSIPNNLKYSKDHEWISVEGDVATIGITAFAQGELGDIVYVDVETEGETLGQEEVFGTVEAVKTVSDLFMPISGEVVEFNTELEGEPELINTDPYGKGWIIKVKVEDVAQLEALLDAAAYGDLIEILQGTLTFLHRSFDFVDLMANLSGITIAYIIVIYYLQHKKTQ